MKIAVGIATTMQIANEVSQADGRFALNPTLTMVCTSDIVNDIAIAMIAGPGTARTCDRCGGLWAWVVPQEPRS